MTIAYRAPSPPGMGYPAFVEPKPPRRVEAPAGNEPSPQRRPGPTAFKRRALLHILEAAKLEALHTRILTERRWP